MTLATLNIVVLAGDRGADDPLCRAAGVAAKALVPVGGQPVLFRVLDALASRREPGLRIVSGPRSEALATRRPDLIDSLSDRGWAWRAPAASPALSALEAVVEVTQGSATAGPILLTTADHALLSPALIDDFLTAALKARAEGADLAVGFVPLGVVQARFPEARRTPLPFSDGAVCSCNLFALLTPAAHRVIDLWRAVERDRKSPWKVVRLLGPLTLLRFALRRLTLRDALAKLSDVGGACVAPVLLTDPLAAVDVDSVADWHLVQSLLDNSPP
ncbi:MAG: NTP transferase domain-containing protein [Pseudomonadales bacterium]